MRKLLFFGILVILMGFMGFSRSMVSFNANNLLLGNIEALASNESEQIQVSECYKDASIEPNASSAVAYTICNDATSHTEIYFCLQNTKQGSVIKQDIYKCKTR